MIYYAKLQTDIQQCYRQYISRAIPKEIKIGHNEKNDK